MVDFLPTKPPTNIDRTSRRVSRSLEPVDDAAHDRLDAEPGAMFAIWGALRSALVASIRTKTKQVEGLESHINIHRIMHLTIICPSFVAGNVCMQEFKAPESEEDYKQ